ncbi:MAG: alanine--tRNA ligase [Bacilli bacterium]|nr:alanine--tRNA ligase [Bacilli bacterium]
MEIKDTYIKFFEGKGHKHIPSAGVIPENDPTSLFTTAGMQPLVPYLMGEKHPEGTRLVDVQKCFRTNDLEEIGDVTHHTFFEMLGNWSLGDYFKEESITWSFELLTKGFNIPVERLAVTVFEGEGNIPRDEKSASIWKSLGISEDRISYLGKDDNFWIAGNSGPCGPDTEIFYWRSEEPIPEKHDSNDDRWVEIWNNVFMQYYMDEEGNISELSQKNVDTGMGVERITAVLEGKDDNYKTSIWSDVISKIEKLTGKSYDDENYTKAMRIIADHIRAVVMISGDDAGIKPSNTDQGYILRRLIRRTIRYAKTLDIDINSDWDKEIALMIIDKYSSYYSELERNKETILSVLETEKVKFNRTLEKGLREFEKIVSRLDGNTIDKDLSFKLYDTYGFPIELTEELAAEKGLSVDTLGFKEKFKEHQEKSRTASAGKFKGGLSGDGVMETKYHTATHLLNAALKIVVNKDVHQMGSNITAERMRFDFSCDHKLTDEEKKSAEELVNKWISEGLDVTHEVMNKDDALKCGAECMFIEKYPDEVTVYSIGEVSKELCGGPHVQNTSELGYFRIKKEEASSAGVRRIKAVLE